MVVLHERRNKVALALAVTSLALYALLALAVTGPAQTREWLLGYAVAWGLYLTLFLASGDDDWVASTGWLLFWAAAARLVLVGTEPWLSDDLYRYLLDGRVFASGVNPFRYPPADPAVQAIAADLAARVNHPEVVTIYPPWIQLWGWVAAKLGFGATGWRALMTVFDLGVMAAVARLFGGGARGWRAAAVYGLCPLAVWESGANGHLEPLVALPLVLAVLFMQRRRPVAAGVLFGLAILGKYYPLLLLPLWWRRPGFERMAAVAMGVSVVGLAPFALHGVDPTVGLRTYLETWSFNGPFYSLLAGLGLPSTLLRVLPFVVVSVAATVAGARREDPVRQLPLLLFAFLVLGPTLHPWYALWVLPWLGDRPHPGHWSFVAAMGGAYAVWWSVYTTGVWALPHGVAAFLWSLVALGWLSSFWQEGGQTPETV